MNFQQEFADSKKELEETRTFGIEFVQLQKPTDLLGPYGILLREKIEKADGLLLFFSPK